MRKFTLLFSFAAILGLASCSNVEKLLPKKDGLWNVTSVTYRNFVSDVLDSTYVDTNQGTVTFDSDGTGVMTDAVDSTSAFNWSVNDDGDVVTMCQDFLGLPVCFEYEVLESSGKSQTWMATFESGIAGSYTEAEMLMERP